MMESGAGAGVGSGARIVDRGYQHYQGARLGPTYATWVMVWAALRRGLGIRRSMRAKFLPWLLILASYAPVLVVLALHIFVPAAGRAALPSYPDIYNRLMALYMLFAGLVAPDLLCLDRRERVLSLYFAAPITRMHYVAAQLLGLVILLLAITLLPLLALFSGNVLLATSAPDYLRDHLADLWHILLSGGLIALYYGAVAMAIASFTDRRAYATGAYVGLLLVSGAVVPILIRILPQTANEQWLALLDLLYLPKRVVLPLFSYPIDPGLNVWTCAGTSLGIVAVGLALLIWRYQRLRD